MTSASDAAERMAVRDERDKAERGRAVTGMVAAALVATQAIDERFPASVTSALGGLEGYGPAWLSDTADPRGAALRAFVGNLVSMVEHVDAETAEGARHG